MSGSVPSATLSVITYRFTIQLFKFRRHVETT